VARFTRIGQSADGVPPTRTTNIIHQPQEGVQLMNAHDHTREHGGEDFPGEKSKSKSKEKGQSVGPEPISEQRKDDQVAEQVSDAAAEIGGSIRRTGRTILAQQKERAAFDLTAISAAMWQAADRMHEREDHSVAEYVEAAAERVDRVGSYLQDREVEDLLTDVAEFGRRRPEFFIGGLFCAGLMVGRFLKAASVQHAKEYGEEDWPDAGAPEGAYEASYAGGSTPDESLSSHKSAARATPGPSGTFPTGSEFQP
jgi:hypothetical protein